MNALTWLDLVYLMAAGACLTLAALHSGIWLRQRSERAHLLLALGALAVVRIAWIEQGLLAAASPEQFEATLRSIHGPLLVMSFAISGFAWSYFGAGRLWLFLVAGALRVAVWLANAWLPHGVNYERVVGLEGFALSTDVAVTVAVGIPTAWNHLDLVAWLALVLFVGDSARTAWEREPALRGRISRVGGAILVAFGLGVSLSGLIHAGLLRVPYFVTPFFLIILAVMAGELVADVVRAARLSRALRASEERLRASELDLELAAEAAGLSMGSLDLESGELATTARGREVFGFGPDERILLDDLLARVHPDDRERIRAAIATAAASRGSYEEVYRLTSPEGGWRWLASRGRVGLDESGRHLRMRGVTFEITARREAEESFRRVFEAAQSALLIVAADGRITLANARAEAYFGYSTEELVGATIERLLPERLRDAHLAHRAEYAREPAARPMGLGYDLVARRRDGSEFPVEIGLSPLPGPGGGAVLASIVDISERREAELAAARQRSELAHLSRVAVLGELSASLAHELNQPLAAILSNAQAAQRFLAREPVDLAQVRDIVSDIVEDDKRAGEVIRRLRAMLRKETLAYLPLDFNEVVRDVLQIMHSDLINRGVTVETRLARRLPKVAGDRVQLQQVLLNLLMNGCDAMAERPKPRRLTVRTAPSGEGGVEVAISDSGIGIAPGELERVFEPFVTTKQQGTGLGLAVCRTIVAAHGGRIRAANNEAGGAVFTVELPRDAA